METVEKEVFDEHKVALELGYSQEDIVMLDNLKKVFDYWHDEIWNERATFEDFPKIDSKLSQEYHSYRRKLCSAKVRAWEDRRKRYSAEKDKTGLEAQPLGYGYKLAMSDTRLKIYGEVVEYTTPIPEFDKQRPMAIKVNILKKSDYQKEECEKFVSVFTKIQTNQIKKAIDKDTLLIVTPSSSGNNPLPEMFANRIGELTHCKVKDLSGISISIDIEAKLAYTLDQRNARFAPYEIDVELLQQQCKGYKKIVLVDDIIATGETVINLANQLQANDIPVTGAIAMVPFTTRYPSNQELKDFSDKIVNAFCFDNDDERKAFEKKINKVFGDYLDIRLKREERKTFSV